MSLIFQKMINVFLKNNIPQSLPSGNSFEVIYFKTGSGIISIGNSNYKFSSGTFAVIEPDTHKDIVVTCETEVSSIYFCNDDERDLLKNGLYYDNNRVIHKYFDKIWMEYNDQKKYQDKFLNIICSELFFAILREDEEDKTNLHGVQHIVNYINEYYNEELRVETLAKMSQYSTRHFRLLFLKETGYTPIDYIIKCRVNAAKDMLINTDDSIVNISQTCGFSSSSQFSSLFRRETGETPMKFRQNNRNKI